MSNGTPTRLRVTEIGEYIRHRSCDRRFKLEINGRAEARTLPFVDRLFNALDPVLQRVGREREDVWEGTLQAVGLQNLTPVPSGQERQEMPWADFAPAVAGLPVGQAAYAREVAVEGPLGAFLVAGNIDFVVVLWEGTTPRLRLVECKASRRDRTYHRIQVALYRMLVRGILAATPLVVGGQAVDPNAVECVVARIDESTNTNQSILALEPLDLATEETDIGRLLAPGGRLDTINHTPVGNLAFRLDQKCDGCVFNIHCLTESARQRRLELVGLDPSTTRTIRDAGVTDLDQLADMDAAADPRAAHLRQSPGFTENLELLVLHAQARRRTLPGGGTHPDEYEVQALPHTGRGQLPPHESGGVRLMRIYLVVDYDYTEDRIGALSAHVTTSPGRIHTSFVNTAGSWRPHPQILEQHEAGQDAAGHMTYTEHPLPPGQEIVRYKMTPWTGNYHADTVAERDLIAGFFHELVGLIAQVAGQPRVPLHFYVWSRNEMRQLIEGCSRAGSGLLGHLRELLGCRESLEQMIYSCLQDEVSQRFALGWTGRGLGVVSSLRWFGRRYHWKRVVSGQPCNLDHEMTQDIFDFKTQLDLDAANQWTIDDAASVVSHRFEIRSRFNDSLPAAYWHALWNTLPAPASVRPTNPRLANAIQRYNRAHAPNVLREYLRARTHALRWVEENVRFKNEDIQKPTMEVAQLPTFTLDRDRVDLSAVDFLRLDQHVKFTNWLAWHLAPPAVRVPTGLTLPLRDITAVNRQTLHATIDLAGFGLTLAALATRCPFTQDSFVRLSPWSGDPNQGQTIPQLTTAIGRTGVIQQIDWNTGQVVIDSVFQEEDHYTLASGSTPSPTYPVQVFDHATLDENASDFVARRVERRLRNASPIYDWFDTVDPHPPMQPQRPDLELNAYRAMLSGLALPPHGHPPAHDQIEAAVEGLNTRIQLMQGPPGTGKTSTSALAVLLRILTGCSAGDVVLVAGHTHTSIDTLLRRIDEYRGVFGAGAAASALTFPQVAVVKVHSAADNLHPQPGGGVGNIAAAGTTRQINNLRKNAVLVLGGTTSALLKLAGELLGKKTFNDGDGLFTPLLVVDEASMMVFPHFLALATLVNADGQIMLSGDHRQLAPIVAHDWRNEDRPPTVLYQPYNSSFEAVRRISASPNVTAAAVRRSALTLTFRLPPVVIELISRLYQLDQIVLQGLPRPAAAGPPGGDLWAQAWHRSHGLFLVVHDEQGSRRSNPLEVAVIQNLLATSPGLPSGSLAVITPHRAQRSLLTATLGPYRSPAGSVDVIDTVERLQGGERPTVVVSATVSDPAAIEAAADFVLDLNRANVAFSRVQDRLVVVCSETLLNHIPSDLEHYQSAMLWKSLRDLCSVELASCNLGGHSLRLLTPPLPPP
jgi:hypothetical protein